MMTNYLSAKAMSSIRAIIICIAISLSCGCKKTADQNAAKIKLTISTIEMNMRAERGVKAQLLQKVLNDLQHTSAESLKTPHLSAIVLWGEANVPRAEFWWIEDRPTADGIILRWAANPNGSYLRIPQSILDASNNDKVESQLICHASGVPLAPYVHDGLSLPVVGIEGALARDGKAISSFIECPSLLQKVSTTSPQPGK